MVTWETKARMESSLGSNNHESKLNPSKTRCGLIKYVPYDDGASRTGYRKWFIKGKGSVFQAGQMAKDKVLRVPPPRNLDRLSVGAILKDHCISHANHLRWSGQRRDGSLWNTFIELLKEKLVGKKKLKLYIKINLLLKVTLLMLQWE